MLNEQQLIRDLAAPIKSFRLYALEQALSVRPSGALVTALRERLRTEDDAECRVLLEHALAHHAPGGTRQPATHDAATASLSGESEEPDSEFPIRFATAEPSERLRLLDSLRNRIDSLPANFGPCLLAGERHPAVAATIIRLFRRVWPAANFSDLLSRLTADTGGVRHAALEALIDRWPDGLASVLPPLLVSDDPRLRALAVQGLAIIDADEAVNHLQAMLLEGSSGERLAGLRSAFLLPFAAVREPLLKFVAAETDLTLVEQAGLHFQINPDPQIPYRLWELAEVSTGPKQQVLKKMVQGAINAISASGKLREDLGCYSSRLQEWIRRRLATRYVQECLSRLAFSDSAQNSELLESIRENLAQPEVRTALQETLEWPLPPQVHATIRGILSPESQTDPKPAGGTEPVPASSPAPNPVPPPIPVQVPPPAADSPTGKKASTSDTFQDALRQGVEKSAGPTGEEQQAGASPFQEFSRLSREEQIRRMSGWDSEQKGRVGLILQGLLQQDSLDPEVRAAALNAALRLELDGFSASAIKGLNHSDPNVAAAALGYLGRFSFDQIMPQFGQFTQHRQPRIRAAALRILQREDPAQAVPVLLGMLRNEDQESRQQALPCMVQFDFSLIRDGLCALLETPSGDPLLEPILCLFEANADPEHLYPLFRTEQFLAAPRRQLAQNARSRMETTLEKAGRLRSDEREARQKQMRERWSQEQAKRAAPPPAYALKVLRPESKKVQESAFEHLGVGFFHLLFQARWLLAGLAGLAFLFFLFEILAAGGDQPTRKSRYRLQQPVSISGEISALALEQREWKLRARDATIFVFPISDVPRSVIKLNNRLEMTVIPIAIRPDGEIVARVQMMVESGSGKPGGER